MRLSRARAAPDDTFSKRQLVDCYVRQDQHARALPLLDSSSPTATWCAALTGTPYETHGAQTRPVKPSSAAIWSPSTWVC
jgi:hypothetical protein